MAGGFIAALMFGLLWGFIDGIRKQRKRRAPPRLSRRERRELNELNSLNELERETEREQLQTELTSLYEQRELLTALARKQPDELINERDIRRALTLERQFYNNEKRINALEHKKNRF